MHSTNRPNGEHSIPENSPHILFTFATERKCFSNCFRTSVCGRRGSTVSRCNFTAFLGCNSPNEFSVSWRLSARITRTIIIIAWAAFFVYLIYDTITGSLHSVEHFSSFHRECEWNGWKKTSVFLLLATFHIPLCVSVAILERRCNQPNSFCSDCDHLLLCLTERSGTKCVRMCAPESRPTQTMRRSVQKKLDALNYRDLRIVIKDIVKKRKRNKNFGEMKTCEAEYIVPYAHHTPKVTNEDEQRRQ